MLFTYNQYPKSHKWFFLSSETVASNASEVICYQVWTKVLILDQQEFWRLLAGAMESKIIAQNFQWWQTVSL